MINYPVQTESPPLILLKNWPNAQEDAYSVRKAVFIEEKGVPEDMEIDEFDSIADHALAYLAGQCVATARLVCLPKLSDSEGRAGSIGRIGRMAVLEPFRGHGLGRQMLEALIQRAKSLGIREFHLHAQVDAIPFYERAGFLTRGDIYDEVGIPHRDMILILSQDNH